MDKSNENSISLNKYISQTGLCSRREADELIDQGRVMLKGVIAKKGNRVFSGDIVLLDGKEVSNTAEKVYILLNKPRGVVCTTDPKESNNIVNFVNHQQRIFPVGRLDKDSEGLIILTNDGDIVNKILRSGNAHEKEYYVRVDYEIDKRFKKKMESGIPILDTVTKPCKVNLIDEYSFHITLTEGLNRQIRRMCHYLDYEVVKLKRVRIMHLSLDELPYGKWRDFSGEELKELNQAVKNSEKHFE